MAKTKRLALAALMTALSVVLVWLAALMPTGSVAVVAVCGIVTSIVVINCGYRWALGHFTVVAVLSLLLIPDVGVAMMYVAMLRWYPIAKSFFEMRKFHIALKWVCKLIIAAAAIAAWIAILRFVFTISASELYAEIPGLPAAVSVQILFVVMLAVFVLYDIALSRVIIWFTNRILTR